MRKVRRTLVVVLALVLVTAVVLAGVVIGQGARHAQQGFQGAASTRHAFLIPVVRRGLRGAGINPFPGLACAALPMALTLPANTLGTALACAAGAAAGAASFLACRSASFSSASVISIEAFLRSA